MVFREEKFTTGEKDGVEMRYISASCLEFGVARKVVEGYDFFKFILLRKKNIRGVKCDSFFQEWTLLIKIIVYYFFFQSENRVISITLILRGYYGTIEEYANH